MLLVRKFACKYYLISNFLNSCFIEFIVYLIKSWLLQASFGGKLRFVLTASAPISPTVLSFLRAVLGCFIFEGYGQTECTAGCTFSMPGDWSTGSTASHPLTVTAKNRAPNELADVSFFSRTRRGSAALLHGEAGGHPWYEVLRCGQEGRGELILICGGFLKVEASADSLFVSSDLY